MLIVEDEPSIDEGPARWFEPFEEAPDLFFRFAQLYKEDGLSEEEILRWTHKHGLLYDQPPGVTRRPGDNEHCARALETDRLLLGEKGSGVMSTRAFILLSYWAHVALRLVYAYQEKNEQRIEASLRQYGLLESHWENWLHNYRFGSRLHKAEKPAVLPSAPGAEAELLRQQVLRAAAPGEEPEVETRPARQESCRRAISLPE